MFRQINKTLISFQAGESNKKCPQGDLHASDKNILSTQCRLDLAQLRELFQRAK
jgi:hypothetical protein